MRTFIVLGHDAAIDPDFLLRDLPGSAGRLDVLCRCVNSAFFLSHGLREDVRVLLVLQDRFIIRIEGSEVKYLNPDERTTASLLKKALEKATVTDTHTEQRAMPGIYIRDGGFADALDSVDGSIIQLHEYGESPNGFRPLDDPVFVLSDHNDFTEEEETLLTEYADRRLRIGPKIVHADHAITIVQHLLDTDGYQHF